MTLNTSVPEGTSAPQPWPCRGMMRPARNETFDGDRFFYEIYDGKEWLDWISPAGARLIRELELT